MNLVQKNYRTKRGFTLVELLVVIAITVVLASLIFAGARMSMRKAKSVKCMSNLRQLGSVIFDYAADNNGGVVLKSNGQGWPSKGSGSPFEQYTPSITDFRVMRGCPLSSNYDPVSGAPGYALVVPRSTSGATPSAIVADQPTFRLASIVNPNQFMLFIDAVESSAPTINSVASFETIVKPICIKGTRDCRHDGGAHVFFADGHVAWHVYQSKNPRDRNSIYANRDRWITFDSSSSF